MSSSSKLTVKSSLQRMSSSRSSTGKKPSKTFSNYRIRGMKSCIAKVQRWRKKTLGCKKSCKKYCTNVEGRSVTLVESKFRIWIMKKSLKEALFMSLKRRIRRDRKSRVINHLLFRTIRSSHKYLIKVSLRLSYSLSHFRNLQHLRF